MTTWSGDKSKGIHPSGSDKPGWKERVEEALGAPVRFRVLENDFEGGHEGLEPSYGPGALAVLRSLVPPPPPKLGGTYTFCPWIRKETRSGGITVQACASRWKGKHALAKYRRHWRRFHAAAPVLVRHGTVTGRLRWQEDPEIREMARKSGLVVPLTDSERTGLDAMDKINERLRKRRGREH